MSGEEKKITSDDACEACGEQTANRECAHGMLCSTCDEQVHGEIDGPCWLEYFK